MLRTFVITCLLIIAVSCDTDQDPVDKEIADLNVPFLPEKVLFIGNSHTNYNEGIDFHLREFLKATSLPFTPIVEKITMDGYTMEQHSEDDNTLSKISEKEWDIIVFQENTYRAAYEALDAKVGMQNLRFKIKNPNTKVLLFMTWAYEDSPNMINAIKATYEETAQLTNAIVIPVGIAFRDVPNDPDNNIDLYNEDGIHPSLEGTFLATAMFYARIYEKDPIENSYTANLTKENADYLKQAAKTVLKDYPN